MEPSSGTEALAPEIQELLDDLVDAARASFQDDLKSVILFGSAAEGKMRSTSDLNLLLVLARFEKARVDAFREPLRLARVAARASVMFVLESELAAAAENFAVKFDDISRRHRVLYGSDALAGVSGSRQAKKARLMQVLLNLSLRLRERYAAASLREEQLATVIAESAGPMRSSAATLLELEGAPVSSPKTALESLAASLDPAWAQTLKEISQARETGTLPAGQGANTMFQLMQLTAAMLKRAEKVS